MCWVFLQTKQEKPDEESLINREKQTHSKQKMKKAKKTIITETQKKPKNEQNEPHQKPGMKSGTEEGGAVPTPFAIFVALRKGKGSVTYSFNLSF